MNIYSRLDETKLLHKVVRLNDVQDGRIDLIEPDNFIQCSLLKMQNGKTFRPHQHIWKERNQKVIAQESWVVIRGRVKCLFYDTDGKFLHSEILEPGDASFTLEGGHNYVSLQDDTIVYEYKTGPYEGQELDKVFLR